MHDFKLTLTALLHPFLASRSSETETEYLAFGGAASLNLAAHSSLQARTCSLGAPVSPFAPLHLVVCCRETCAYSVG